MSFIFAYFFIYVTWQSFFILFAWNDNFDYVDVDHVVIVFFPCLIHPPDGRDIFPLSLSSAG